MTGQGGASGLDVDHALVVGGTGMLRGATRAIGKSAGSLTAIARTPARLASLERDVADGGGRMMAVALDYRETDQVIQALEARVSSDGPIGLAVCWIHGTAPEAPAVIARLVDPDSGRYFHVLPDRARDPAVVDRLSEPIKRANPGLRYRVVVLGSVTEGGSSRWLTHEEISAGVLEAIDRDRDHVIGDG